MAWRGTVRRWGPAILGIVVLPVAAAAQDAVEHRSVYTQLVPDVSVAAPARSPMPRISPSVLPRATLLRAVAPHESVPAAAASGSADGTTPREQALGALVPDAFGIASELAVAPYSTARASADKLGKAPNVAAEVAVTSYPWRATGKLYFNISGVAYVCTASLIKPGLLVTAAHCVFEFGKKTGGWHTDFVFAPAQYASGSPPPYGTWTVTSELVPGPYIAGYDTCATRGVVCNNDIAVLVMAKNPAGQLPGTVVGYYGYGWGGYSSVLSFGGAQLSSITQFGYPVAFDSGLMLERNDGVGGLWTSGALKNTVLGSALTGGSSGGPWLVNFGSAPTIDTSAASLGTSSKANVVVGVTSWGYTTLGDNTQGASFFGPNKEFPASAYTDTHKVNRGAGNIGYLVTAACNAHYDHC